MTNLKTNKVKHPNHYNWIEGHECWEVAQHFNYNKGCALKYIWRAGRKKDEIEDLQKAINYLEQEITRLTNDKSSR